MHRTEDIITAEAAGTLDGLMIERAHRNPDDVAYVQYEKSSREWVNTSWSEAVLEIGRWRAAMAELGLAKGDRVALLMRNSREWVFAEQAALNLGLVIVPLYCDDRPDNIAYILRDAATRLLVVNDNLWRRVAKACQKVESLRHVVLVPAENHECETDGETLCSPEWLPDSAPPPRRRDADPDALATIVYTSGTTGRPKGVMLSHRNILSIAHAALKNYDIFRDDLFLSFLPLSHTFERTVGYYVPMMGGSSVAYARSIAQLAEDLKQLKPRVLIAVPRIFEKFYARIEQGLEKKSFLARALFKLTVSVGWARFEKQQHRASALRGLYASLFWPLCDRLVASKIRALMGGNLRLCVSGGAALPGEVARTLIGLGLTICQGYGLTETSPVICGNPVEDNDPASVGVCLRGIEVKIGENDELLVKSPGIMLGYWNNHAATADMIDADGWLHTGDQARIENNHVYITGRLKDILVLSNGEKVPPADMELAICIDPLFEQAVVLGEGESYLSAIIVLNTEEWIRVASLAMLDPYSSDNLNHPRIHKEVLARIRKQLTDFPGYAKIRRVTLTLEPWTVDNGLLTPTLKVKRAKVMQVYADAIREIYD
jgi:long-chain acyl-CoA synthetase